MGLAGSISVFWGKTKNREASQFDTFRLRKLRFSATPDAILVSPTAKCECTLLPHFVETFKHTLRNWDGKHCCVSRSLSRKRNQPLLMDHG